MRTQNEPTRVTSVENIGRLVDHLDDKHVQFGIAHLHRSAHDMAERAGLLTMIGADHLFDNTGDAVAWASHQVTNAAASPATSGDRQGQPGRVTAES